MKKKFTHLISLFVLLLFTAGTTYAQTRSITLPATGNYSSTPVDLSSNDYRGTVRVYDNGGNNKNYSSGCNGYVVLDSGDPTKGLKVTSGTCGLRLADYLYFYDGNGTSKTVLDSYTNKSDNTALTTGELSNLISTGRYLTIQLVDYNGPMDGGQRQGFNIVVETFDFSVTPNSGVVYVRPAAYGNQTGSNWANATTLQRAFDARVAGTNITEIRVAAGTYKPTHTVVGNTTPSRERTFNIPAGVAIKGGYSSMNGTDTTRGGTSTLSGDIDTSGNNDAYHVVSISGVKSSGSLDGFTITGGRATASNGTLADGAGVYMMNASYFTLSNITVTGNRANSEGGGIYMNGVGHITLSNVTVTGNTATSYGGGIYVYNTISGNDNGTIFNGITVTGNTVGSSGSGNDIYNGHDRISLRGKSVLGTGDDNGTYRGVYFADGRSFVAYVNSPTYFQTGSVVRVEGASDLDDYIVRRSTDSSYPDSNGDVLYFETSDEYELTPAVNNDRRHLYLQESGIKPDRDGIVYVTVNGTGNGKSWATAANLQEALAAVADNSAIQKIYVYAGTYKPTTTTDRTATFNIPAGVSILGGFNDTVQNTRGGVSYLDGDIRDGSDDAYHVVTVSGNKRANNRNALLDGFTIRNGRATGNGANANGAGLYIANDVSNFSVTNITVSGNIANGNGADVYAASDLVINGAVSVLGAGKVGNNYRGIYLAANKKLVVDAGALTTGSKFYIEGAATMYSVVAERASDDFTQTQLNNYFATDGDNYQLYLQDGKIYIRPIIKPTNGIVYVKKGGAGLQNGSSWANALPELAYALKDNPSGMTTVYVAAGTYNPMYAPESSTNNADKTFLLLKDVKIYGGFAGNNGETLAGRNFTNNQTTLAGGNVYHVVLSVGDVGNACLDGFTISGGSSENVGFLNVNGIDCYRAIGAGVFVNSSSPALANLKVTANSASRAGGGMNITGTSNPTLTNVDVYGNNSAYSDGGDIATSQNIVVSGKSQLGTGIVSSSYEGIYLLDDSKLIINNNALVTGTKFYIEGAKTMYSVVAEKSSNGSFTETEMNTYFSTNQNKYRLYLEAGKIRIRPVTAPSASGIVYVRKDGSGNGSSWNSALPELAYALLDKPSAMRTVYVAAGTYLPMYTADGKMSPERERTFVLPAGVNIYGGFNASTPETTHGGRAASGNTTTLSGNIAANNNDAYHVVYATGNMNNAVLDRFTVSGGRATAESGSSAYGGGIYLRDLRNFTINNVSVSGNTATNGGAGISSQSSSPVITNSTISGNTVNDGGGAGIWAANAVSPTLTNVIITGNTAVYAAGIYGVNGPVFNMTGVTVSGNTATGESAGHDITTTGNINVSGASVSVLGTGKGSSDSDPYKGIKLLSGAKLVINPNALVDGAKFHIESAETMYSVVAEKTSGNFTDLELETYFTTDDSKYVLCVKNGDIYIRPVTAKYNGIAYVKKDGAGTRDGSSWANAAPELAYALLDAQKENIGIDAIYVAKGTYSPLHLPAKATGAMIDKDRTFLMVKDVKVYGGFDGTKEEELDERNFSTNETILDGLNYYYHVVLSSGDIGEACLNGFTVTGGNANSDSSLDFGSKTYSRLDGGGIYLFLSSPVLENLILSENHANREGGAIHNNTSSPKITNVTITNNTAKGGAAMYNYKFGGNCTPELTNVIITGNTASENGGGIYNNSNSTPVLTNVTITGNIASYDGGGIYNNSSSPVLTNVAIINNTTNGEGGGIYNSAHLSRPELTNVTIAGNNANEGGGIYNYWGDKTINNTIIAGNKATVNYPDLYIYDDDETSLTANYSLIGDATNTNKPIVVGEGTLVNVEPIFVDAAAGDYRLAVGSCAINAGSNALYLAARGVEEFDAEVDVLGNARLIDKYIDMGAYESTVVFDPTIVADPTTIDFGIFITAFDQESTINPAFEVSGSDLFGNIFLDLEQVYNLFAIINDVDEFAKECPGYEVSATGVGATFNPALFGRHEATVVLTTEGSGEEDVEVEVTLVGTATMDLEHYDYSVDYITCNSFEITLPNVPGVERFELMIQSPDDTQESRFYYYNPGTPMTIDGLEENTTYRLHIHLYGNNHDAYFWLNDVTTLYCPEWTVTPAELADLEVRVDEQGSAELTVDGKGLYSNITVTIAGAPEFTLTSNEIDVNNGDIFQDMTTVEFLAAEPGVYTAEITFTSVETDVFGEVRETSEVRTITATARPLPIYTPVALEASEVTCEGFTANWEALVDENEELVDIYILTLFNEGEEVVSVELDSEATSYIFTELNEETLYTYSLVGIFNGVATDVSNEVSVETTVCPIPELTWVGDVDSDWNNPNNWIPNQVPTEEAIVTISGGAENFPVLEEATTVADIHIEAGAEIGRHDLLTYNKADVQLDMSTRDGRWNMLTIPVTGIYTGDLSFGGFPYTYIRRFVTNQNADGMTYADWSKEYAQNDEALVPGEGFLYYVNPEGTEFGSRYQGQGRDSQISVANRTYGLGTVESIIQLPYHENQQLSDAHRVHKYDARRDQSTFYYFNSRGLLINPKPEVVSRKDSYRLMDETLFVKEVQFAEAADADGDFMALVGNPFMSTIDFNAIYEGNEGFIKPAYHVYTGAGFSTYDAEGGSGIVSIDEYIAPMQSFLIEKGEFDESTFDFVLDAEKVSATGKGIMKAQAQVNDKLVITASNEYATVRTYIATRDNVSSTRKLMNEVTEVPEIYTLQGERAVGGQTIDSYNALIPVGVKTSYEGNITMTLSGMDNYNAQITLIDMAEGRYIDLTGQASFEYNFAGESNDNRFYVEINPAPTSLDAVDGQVLVYAENKSIKVVSGSELIKEVYVVNAQGQTVFGINTLNTNNYTVSSLAQQAEMYVVKVVTENGVINKKVMLK